MSIILNKPAVETNQLQPVAVAINRALTEPQAGQFYGSPVRLPGSERFREYQGEIVFSVPATFEPLGVDGEGKTIPHLVRIRVGGGYETRDVTGMSCSLAMKQSDYEDLHDLDGQKYIVMLDAKVNLNALKDHGREGTFWVENLNADLNLVEAEGPIAAATVEQLDASLAKGKRFSEERLEAAQARRQERFEIRPKNIMSQAERAAQVASLTKFGGKMADVAARASGMNTDTTPTQPRPGGSTNPVSAGTPKPQDAISATEAGKGELGKGGAPKPTGHPPEPRQQDENPSA